MRHLKVMSLSLLTVALLAPAAHAYNTAQGNLTVTANVGQTCLVNNSLLALGSYDSIANATTPLDATSSLSINCSAGATAILGLGQGLHADTGSTEALPARRLSNGATTPDYLSYNLYQDAGHAAVWGNTTGAGGTGIVYTGTGALDSSVTVYGRVASGQTPIGAGVYTDTVVITAYY